MDLNALANDDPAANLNAFAFNDPVDDPGTTADDPVMDRSANTAIASASLVRVRDITGTSNAAAVVTNCSVCLAATSTTDVGVVAVTPVPITSSSLSIIVICGETHVAGATRITDVLPTSVVSISDGLSENGQANDAAMIPRVFTTAAPSNVTVSLIAVQSRRLFVTSPVSGHGLNVRTTAIKSRGVSRGAPVSLLSQGNGRTLTGTHNILTDNDPTAHSLGTIPIRVWPSIALALDTLADNDPSIRRHTNLKTLLCNYLVFLVMLPIVPPAEQSCCPPNSITQLLDSL